MHCYAIAGLLGRPGSMPVVDHGIDYIWNRHRDRTHGGYHWSIGRDGPVDDAKQGYGHAFVLLAASSAKLVGHPLADAMLADITRYSTAVSGTRLRRDRRGVPPTGSRSTAGGYRGQNSNMHLTEALMAAFEATGEAEYLRKAKRIAERVINVAARSVGWRVAEHFRADWSIDEAYRHPNEMFRPPAPRRGHWLEWTRLVLQLWVLDGKREAWMVEAAEGMFRQAMAIGWDADRAASSTRSTGRIARTSASSSGGRLVRRSAPRTSWRSSSPARNGKRPTAGSGT